MSKIVILRLHSGIGNQFFQFNFLNYLRKHYEIKKVYYDLSHYYPKLLWKKNNSFYLDNKYGIKFHLNRLTNINPTNFITIALLKKISKYNNKYLNIKFLPIRVDDLNYNDTSLFVKYKYIYLTGVFLDRELIVNETIDFLREKGYLLIKDKIKNMNLNNSVSIHIRGKQYIELDINKTYLQPISINYYKNAVKYISDIIKNPNFYIFSNDIDYARNICSKLNLKNFTIIENNFDDLESLFLMSMCSNNIIVNSSYSYWAAILNKNKNKIVISPKYFFNKNHFHYEIAQNLPLKNWVLINN